MHLVIARHQRNWLQSNETHARSILWNENRFQSSTRCWNDNGFIAASVGGDLVRPKSHMSMFGENRDFSPDISWAVGRKPNFSTAFHIMNVEVRNLTYTEGYTRRTSVLRLFSGQN